MPKHTVQTDPETSKPVVALISFAFLVAASGPAYAYLDPGSTSLTIQAIVAAVAGAAATWKYWYWRVLSFLGGNRTRDAETNDAGDSQSAPENADPPPSE